jgi:hypothetical protein
MSPGGHAVWPGGGTASRWHSPAGFFFTFTHPYRKLKAFNLFLIMIRFLIQKVSLPLADFFRTFLYVAPNTPLFSLPKLKLAPQRIRLKNSSELKNRQSSHEPFA